MPKRESIGDALVKGAIGGSPLHAPPTVMISKTRLLKCTSEQEMDEMIAKTRADLDAMQNWKNFVAHEAADTTASKRAKQADISSYLARGGPSNAQTEAQPEPPSSRSPPRKAAASRHARRSKRRCLRSAAAAAFPGAAMMMRFRCERALLTCAHVHGERGGGDEAATT